MNLRRMLPLALLFSALVVHAAEPTPIVVERTEQRTLVSVSNDVAYKLYISLPHSYGTAGRRFPVVYLLDPDYSFFIARNITDHLAERNDLPEVILIGIAYDGPLQYKLNRTRDYTPSFVATGGYGPEFQKVSGGAAKFRDFLKAELIPFIDKTYDTVTGDRALVGHSYGGLFASWILVTQPALFTRYVIVSPSLWYDDNLLFRMTLPPSMDGRVYMTAGDSEDPVMPGDVRRLASLLRAHHYTLLALSADVLNHENHNTLFPRALSNGLRFVFNVR